MLDIHPEFNVKIDVFSCQTCFLFPATETIHMNLSHEQAIHKDFGMGFRGWATGGQCSLGDQCKSPDCRTLNRGCSVCKSIIHEGECMNIHKKEQLEKEHDTWVKTNIFLVEKHYKRLKRKGIISDEKYKKLIESLSAYA